MLRLRITLPSLCLLRPVDIVAALPTRFGADSTSCRTVWALHCAMGNGDFFFDRLDAANLVDKMQVAFIAPSLGNGYFINSPYEQQADCLQEILQTLQKQLCLAPQPASNFAVGISMGAFGALRWALTSEHFGGVAAISGVFDCRLPVDERLRTSRAQRALHATFAKIMQRLLMNEDGTVRQDADFERLVMQAGARLPMAFYCGRQDYLSLMQTRYLEQLCRQHGHPASLHLADGEHDERYWKIALHDAVSTFCHNRISAA